MDALLEKFQNDPSLSNLTLGELIDLAETENVSLSQIVITEAMAKENKTYDEILAGVMANFDHNLKAMDVGLTWGRSFLLGTVGSDLAGQEEPALIDDVLIDRALKYTLATEVGNHEVGLKPCAGTGDACPFTGLIRALRESGHDREKVARAAALILKIGSIFRVGKRTTGCNMEGFGAGAAGTAAALTDLRGGTARQCAKAIVLAMSPTIAVPCTPRVMVSGLCAAHISGAILIGNQAANLVLKTSLPLDVDVDVMMAMAARIHVEAAPKITEINLRYLSPYFKKKPQIEPFVDASIREREIREADQVKMEAKAEMRRMMAAARPLTNVLDNVVVGGSSIAVGSPTNMARICHEMISGKIKRIRVDLTLDLFSRRAINMPAVLMAAVFGARTDDAEMYRKVLDLPDLNDIEVTVNKVDEPEVQRIRIEASEKSAMIDARNRGGGRVTIVGAEPSLEEALQAAEKLGIEVAH